MAEIPANGVVVSEVATRPTHAQTPPWTVLAAVAALATLVGGGAVAATAQPDYDWTTQSISDLAGYGATDRWIMTGAFLLLGLCQILTAVGLRPIRLHARILLAIGGATTMAVAGCPVPPVGGSLRHGIIAATASTLVAVWSMLAFDRAQPLPWILGPRVRAVAVVVQLALLGLYVAVLQTGAWSGVLERAAAAAESLWVLIVAVACRRLVGPAGKSVDGG